MIAHAIINGIDMAAYGMTLSHKEIGTAEAQYNMVSVPGSSKKIDVTDFIGLYFDNREVLMDFKIEDRNTYTGGRRYLEAMNGSRVHVEFTDDPGIYWDGRLKLESYERATRRFCDVSMTLDADPFPYDQITGAEVKDV